ncbi:MAG: flippase-like domain-containing protein [Clostridia bacterium]|nr:flippase-like domain-containing protein [Clostridia bacterium]
MSKQDNNAPIYTKIEVDEKSNEPVLVEVDAKKIINTEENAKSEEPKAKKPAHKSAGKQLQMKSVFSMATDKAISKRQRTFKLITTLVFIVFIVGVLIFTAYNDFSGVRDGMVSWEQVSEIFSTCWPYLIYALIALFACYLLKGLKLSMLCKTTTGKIHFKTCFETGIIGHYYNSVTPLAVGGQPFEIFHLSKHGVSGGPAATLPVVTFFFNQLGFVVLTIVSLALMTENTFLTSNVDNLTGGVVTAMAITGLVCCLIIPTLVVIFCIFPRLVSTIVAWGIKIGTKLRLIKRPRETEYKILKNVIYNARCIKKIGTKPITLILLFILSVCEHLALTSIAYFTLKFFGFDIVASRGIVEWIQVIQICMILNATISFIPTPGNSGAADISFYALFSAGLAGGLAFPAMMTWRVLNFYSFILIGFVFTTSKNRADKKLLAKNIQPE